MAEWFFVTRLVRNLPDGGVEMVAEGEDTEVDKFLHAVQQAMAGYVRETQVAESPGTNEYSTFSVACRLCCSDGRRWGLGAYAPGSDGGRWALAR